MMPFAYAEPIDIEQTLGLADPESRYIAGGTNLLDLMKESVVKPRRLIDVTGLLLRDIRRAPTGGLLVGAPVSNARLVWNPTVEVDYPLLAQAILIGASPQLCNMVNTGGNLLQRTRCQYFYDTGTPHNKRKPSSGCPARSGLNRNHAILGASEHRVVVHPSDLCVASAALEAQVLVCGRAGGRRITSADFRRLPVDAPGRDNHLAADELVTAIELSVPRFTRHCHYLKACSRASYAFALISVAAALGPDGERIGELRLALGGVAHKPWHVIELEERLKGHPVNRDNYVRSAEAPLHDVRPLARNTFKTGLTRDTIVRALEEVHSEGIGQ